MCQHEDFDVLINILNHQIIFNLYKLSEVWWTIELPDELYFISRWKLTHKQGFHSKISKSQTLKNKTGRPTEDTSKDFLESTEVRVSTPCCISSKTVLPQIMNLMNMNTNIIQSLKLFEYSNNIQTLDLDKQSFASLHTMSVAPHK